MTHAPLTPRIITRRTAMAGLAAAPLAASLSRRAVARTTAHTFKLGAFEISILSDGTMQQPRSFVLPDRPKGEIDSLFESHPGDRDPFLAEVNIVLVKTPTATVLIDSGGTSDFMPTLGTLPDRLEAAGIKPESITHVVFTHAHADHLWGVIDPLDDETRFQKAKHIITTAERDFWLKDDTADSMPDMLKGMAIGTKRRLGMIAKRLDGVALNASVVPGISLIDTSGHTPGHAAVLIESEGQQVLMVGDAIANLVVSFAAPRWPWGSDLDRSKGADMRVRLLDKLATDRLTMIATHLPWPGLARVERHGTAYRYVAG
jgi:glyoxylase-like metal-dependent hydrolase (beta-lactamase superfamily II)